MTNSIKRLMGMDATPADFKETLNNPNASRWDKINSFVDPHHRITPEPPKTPQQQALSAEKRKKKRQDEVYTSARQHGYKGSPPIGMACGGKVKMKKGGSTSCRGMGKAIKGGGFKG